MSFTPTAAEQALVSQIFQVADTTDGKLRGDIAVSLFSGAKLPPPVLREIWNLADDENKGWLSQRGVAMAVRLMAWAQRGEPVSSALLQRPGPIPIIDGVTATPAVLPMPTGYPPITPQDKTKFQNLFQRAGPANGFLSGDKARDIFLKSKLPTDKLSQIWNLADSKDRGYLDATDFAIAMYFIQATMSGQISVIPATLPPGLYQQAGGSATPSLRTHATGTSGSFSPVQSSFPQNRPVQPQYTGSSHLQPQSTGSAFGGIPPPIPARPSPSQIGSGVFGLSVQPAWDITPAEKVNSDRLFDNLDASRRGYIEGEVAVPFMLESKLPSDVLAQIWDLTDIAGDGRLNRDGFAVAMHLIQKKLNGGDLPASLPTSLIPPSMRTRLTNGASSPFSPPANQPQPPEPAKDLFSWDDDTPPPSASTAQSPIPQQQVPFHIPPQRTGPTLSSPPRPSDPFGASAFSTSHFPPQAAAKDFLSDDDDEVGSSRQLHDQSAEIGNLQNQLNSTQRSLQTTKTEKASTEQTLADQAVQLTALQTQLSSAKAAYETESNLLATLKERQGNQTAEIQKSRQELITAESDLSALRAEKAEIEGAFLRDKEEVRALQRKMVEVGQQVESLKHDIEKVKKEAKQQKGLLAIARKQLATKEAERAKIEKESSEAAAKSATLAKEKEEVDAVLEQVTAAALAAPIPQNPFPERTMSADSVSIAAAQPLPLSPEPATPAASIKSRNPFERLTGASTPRPQSPLLPFSATPVQSPGPSIQGDTPIDDPFGLLQAPVTEPIPVQEAPEPEEPPTVANPSAEQPVNPSTSSPAPMVLSPSTPSEDDFFATPLTTAASSPTSNGTHEKQSTIDGIIAKFPPLDTTTEAQMPGHLDHEVSTDVQETDLGSQLKELDVDDSDSDSDDDVPLETIKAKVVQEAKSSDADGASEPPKAAGNTDFDDIFGTTAEPAAPSTSNVESAAFGINESTPAVAGVNAFDEAMSKITPTNPTAATATSPFTFDTAFEDTFDFGSTPNIPPSSSPAPVVANGHASPEPKRDDGFDSLFTTEPTLVNGDNAKTSTAPLANSTAAFDQAFASLEPAPTMPTVTETPSINLETSQVPESPKPFPTTSTPTASPPRPAGPGSPTTRSKSPPPRAASPKSTKSTSKDGHEKKEPAPTRHSKLSIRLPFGKKKKQQPQEPLPPPASLLTPPQEEPARTSSPAVEDDVEAVKQLTAMGFSRTQAVAALEKHGYDVPRALNSLLGAQ